MYEGLTLWIILHFSLYKEFHDTFCFWKVCHHVDNLNINLRSFIAEFEELAYYRIHLIPLLWISGNFCLGFQSPLLVCLATCGHLTPHIQLWYNICQPLAASITAKPLTHLLFQAAVGLEPTL